MNFVRGYPAPHYYAGANLCGSRAQSRTHLGYAEMKQSVRSKHLGSAAYLTSKGHVTQTLNYLPYGEDWIDVQNTLDPRLGQYTFTGKERDEETGYGYFGARYMDYSLMTSFISVDRYASKYPFISPYAYCAWNPIRLIDPTGDTIVIMGGNGKKVYYSPRMEYSGSDGFVKQTVSALNTLNGTDEGSKIINGLHTSNNTFSIHKAESGENRFVPSDLKRARATQIETDPMFKQVYEFYKENGGLSGGSGGMDYRIHEGISRNDWMAVYRENLIRQQLKQPLRTHYSKKLEPDLRNELRVTGGSGTFMLNDGKPYLPVVINVKKSVYEKLLFFIVVFTGSWRTIRLDNYIQIAWI